MSVYVITGVSKGIGVSLLSNLFPFFFPNPPQFEFVKQISENPDDLVVGIVRDKAGTEKKVATELGERSNVHIIHGDLTKYDTLKQAAAETTEIVGNRGIDYLVANGAALPHFDAYSPIGEMYVYSFEVSFVIIQIKKVTMIFFFQ
jgi:NAD(P)-dependent dehydrogenase (short-subunit alcohol dehydrogenase family)